MVKVVIDKKEIVKMVKDLLGSNNVEWCNEGLVVVLNLEDVKKKEIIGT